jgi:hypothetical protein
MRRRDFILTVAGAALWSRTAKGQQASPVVGVLEVGTSGIRSKDFFAPAQARLAEMGFVEGRNLTIEFRGADFQQERLAGLASDGRFHPQSGIDFEATGSPSRASAIGKGHCILLHPDRRLN